MTKDTEIHERDFYKPPARITNNGRRYQPEKIEVGDKAARVGYGGRPLSKGYTVSRIFKVGSRGQWRLGFDEPIDVADQLGGVQDGVLAADFRKVG